MNANLGMAVLVSVVHATAMIAAGGCSAWLVYRYLGLKFVSRSWFNLDTSWAVIPEYRTRGEHALLRGFLSGSRWMTFAVSSIVSLGLAGIVKLLSPWIDANAVVPL